MVKLYVDVAFKVSTKSTYNLYNFAKSIDLGEIVIALEVSSNCINLGKLLFYLFASLTKHLIACFSRSIACGK